MTREPSSNELKLSDRLAQDRTSLANERTHMANERTMLAYFRTGLACVGLGVFLLRFETGQVTRIVGILSIVGGIAIHVYGFKRFLSLRRWIQRQSEVAALVDEKDDV